MAAGMIERCLVKPHLRNTENGVAAHGRVEVAMLLSRGVMQLSVHALQKRLLAGGAEARRVPGPAVGACLHHSEVGKRPHHFVLEIHGSSLLE